MEKTLPEGHPDLQRIVQAAHADVPAADAKPAGNSLAGALAAALGRQPGDAEDRENIEFLVQVLAVNRAEGNIDDAAFAALLERIATRAGRAALVASFTAELEAEHGYADDPPA
ncbi:hypothetical protein ACLIIZ_02725 [Azonexus caeni]|jgi:hypothetical protein|uniref:hypothetical protein n=1 Tax=Azonexus caeni TaxID=266126 RepID=UPI002D0C9CEF|nr:hypothetical protein [Azonexus sp.]